jgi:hypothetical protein
MQTHEPIVVHRAGGTGVHSPAILACMNHDGVSNTAYRRTMAEVRDIAIANGRNPILAHGEFLFRISKTGLGRVVRALSAPAHRFVRNRINRSYAFLDQETLARARH